MEPLEVQLLRKYRSEVQQTREQIRALTTHTSALASAINGLEAILRLRGVDPDEIGDDEMSMPIAAQPVGPTVRTVQSLTAKAPSRLLLAVVTVLNDTDKRLGAKDLHRQLLKKGLVVNYYTLYKNLTREAAKEDGVVVRFGEKFGLRRWATNDAGTGS